MSAISLAVLVPTRNRADLAANAVRALLSQSGAPALTVVVSDNSSTEADRAAVSTFVEGCADPRLRLVRPDAPLSMADHWDWAIGQAFSASGATHLMVNTDRMVIRDGGIADLAARVAAAPQLALSFNLDRVDDLTTPVRLERKRWSGAVAELSSAKVLEMASRVEFPECIPRLLNCVVPAAGIQRVRDRFGDACRSISPDYGFGLRWLAVHERVRFYDRSLLVHYAAGRSNGHSSMRGVETADMHDFKKFMGRDAYFTGAPFPEFITIHNAMVHEYGKVRETLGAGMPPVNVERYVRAVYRDLTGIEDPAKRAGQITQLARRYPGPLLARRRASDWIKRHTRPVELAARRLLRGRHFKPDDRFFPSVAEALEWDRRHPTPRQETHAHLDRWEPLAVVPY